MSRGGSYSTSANVALAAQAPTFNDAKAVFKREDLLVIGSLGEDVSFH